MDDRLILYVGKPDSQLPLPMHYLQVPGLAVRTDSSFRQDPVCTRCKDPWSNHDWLVYPEASGRQVIDCSIKRRERSS